MAVATDIVAIARAAFEDAHGHLDADLAAATPEQARAVTDNHDLILATYMRAVRTAFACTNPEWEQALTQAQSAKKAVDAARAQAASIVARIGAMTGLTKAVCDCVAIAV